MQYVDQSRLLREFLTERGHNLNSKADITFYLDLNQGGMRIDAKTIRKFVGDLKEFFVIYVDYSEINAFMQLVARREDFYKMKTQIYWHRSYHVGYNDNPEQFIMFKDYVKEYV